MAVQWTPSQPTGAGAGVINKNLLEVRVGIAVVLTSEVQPTYQWVLFDRPATSAASLSTPTAITSGFTPDVGGTYVVQLTDPSQLDINGNPLFLRLSLYVNRNNAGITIQRGLIVPGLGVRHDADADVRGAAGVLERFKLKLIEIIDTLGLAPIATNRILGNNSGDIAAPSALTPTEVTAMLDDATTSLPGRLSATFWNLLTGATDAKTSLALARRDINADLGVRRLSVTDQINASGSLAVDSPGSVSVTAASLATINGLAGTNIYGSGGVTIGSFGADIAVDIVSTRPFTIREYLTGLSRWAFRAHAAVDIVTATTTTVATVTPSSAVPAVFDGYVICRRTTSPAAATTAIWRVRQAYLTIASVATPLGSPLIELISTSDDGCSLAWDESTTTARLRLTTPDTTARTAQATTRDSR